MKRVATPRQVKAFEKFNLDLKAFGQETEETFVVLYEDAYTTRKVAANFKLYLNGKLTWTEVTDGEARLEEYHHCDEDDVEDTLSFWKANLRRAKRYWAMDTEILDKIQDGQMEN